MKSVAKSILAQVAPQAFWRGTSAWVSQIVVPILSRIWGGSWSPCVTARLAKIELRGARASRHAVVNSSLVISSVVRSKLDDPKSSTRPQVRRDHPLSLSISISGGKETNKDSLSNGGEREEPSLKIGRLGVGVVWRSVLSDGPGPSSLERGAREVRARRAGPCRTTALSESGCLGMQPQSGGKFRQG
ncbi:hypothetical protein Bca4012_103272 [Brassica carinata]